MALINVKADCGNSPKMEFLKQFNIAFANGDVEFLADSVTDEIVWNIIGNKKIEGKERFTEELKKMQSLKTTELIIDQLLSHGKEGAANGWVITESGKKYAFSNFYVFQGAKGAKIKKITSYEIEIQ